MIYDTGTPKKWLYTWLVKEQVVRISKLIPANKELYIAIPTYDKANDGFDPRVENIKSALQGVINGLNDLRSNSDNFTGIAFYANWTTDALEWKEYSNLFQKI
jgi:exo-beta-1,3-glucanase (GH17 family)